MPEIAKSDRVLCIGQTRSGKSAWMQGHAKLLRSQILEIDVKDDDDVRYAERQRVYYDPKKIDWNQRVISYVPRNGGIDREEMEELFELAWKQGLKRKGLTIILHESIGPTNGNYAPRALERILVQGASRNVRVWTGAQRPVTFYPQLHAQADHVVIFARMYAEQDLRKMANEMTFNSPRHMQQTLQNLQRQYGELGNYAHLWWERATGEVTLMPPMPEWMLP